LLANLMLVALGLYLLGVTRALAFTERAGQNLWRVLQPLTRRFLPARSIPRLFRWACCGAGCPAVWSIVRWPALSAGSAGTRGADDAGFRPRHLAQSLAGRHSVGTAE
jgi:sulfite exporter TauE/SafE